MKALKFILFLIGLIYFPLGINAQTLLIYGGKGQKIFLGCINCSKYDENSIWNQYGEYGSKYNDKCIWNKYGDYGGKYSDYSPFNKYASDPPVLVDPEGNFYGYFTADQYKDKRTQEKLALYIIDYWEIIGEDVNTFYNKIFK